MPFWSETDRLLSVFLPKLRHQVTSSGLPGVQLAKASPLIAGVGMKRQASWRAAWARRGATYRSVDVYVNLDVEEIYGCRDLGVSMTFYGLKMV